MGQDLWDTPYSTALYLCDGHDNENNGDSGQILSCTDAVLYGDVVFVFMLLKQKKVDL